MPSTLAHLAIQAPTGRVVAPRIHPLWWWTGCLLPDVPWILQRVLKQGIDGEARYDLRLWVLCWSSLALCLLLAGAVSSFARRPGQAFGSLALGTGIHFALDLLEREWGQGVLVWAPFDWRLVSWQLVEPDGGLAMGLAVLGLVVLVVGWRGVTRPPWPLICPLNWPCTGSTDGSARLRAGLGLVLVIVWLGAPLLLIDRAEQAGLHSIATLRERELRPGREVVLWNAHWYADTGTVLTLASEPLRLMEPDPAWPERGRISVRGVFETTDTVRVVEARVEREARRTWGAWIGVLGISLAWAVAGVRTWLAGTGAAGDQESPKETSKGRTVGGRG